MSNDDNVVGTPAYFEEVAIQRAPSGLVVGDFRVCTLLPEARWKVERVATRDMAMAMLPDDDDAETSVVVLEMRVTPVKKAPRVKVVTIRPGAFTEKIFGQKYVPQAIGRVRHMSRLHRR